MEKRIESVWDDWKVVRKIGSGGFGAVYEIQRNVFGKSESAALKVISIPRSSEEIDELYNEGYDKEAITRHFRDHLEEHIKEYSLMLDMKGHPNIVYCDDVRYSKHDDDIGWDIFIKMELLTPLTSVLAHDIPESEVIRLGKDICNALVACKKANIVHRDIKPQNIFVSRNGDYKLGDFGIAKMSDKTQSGTRIGTFDYMPPEVYSGKPYGASADVYSLGLVLHWLLNNKKIPFVSDTKEIPSADEKMQARLLRLSGQPVPMPVYGSDELKSIVLKASAYDISHRYFSAEEMLEDLKALEFGTLSVTMPLKRFGDCCEETVLLDENDKPEKIKSEKSKSEKAKNKKIKDKKTKDKKKDSKDTEANATPPKEEKRSKKGLIFVIADVIIVSLIIGFMLLRGCHDEGEYSGLYSIVSEIFNLQNKNGESDSDADNRSESSENLDHEHNINTDVWENGESTHWKSCECGEKTEEAEHDFGEWKVIKEPTEREDGEKQRECQVCSYIQSKAVSKNQTENSQESASWSEWSDDVPSNVTESDYYIEERVLYSTQTLEYMSSTTKDSIDGWELYETVKNTGEYGSWTNWIMQKPDESENRQIEKKTQYRYRDKSVTTSNDFLSNGWIMYDSATQWGEYGNWSDWQEGYVSSSDSRIVETKTQYSYREIQNYSWYGDWGEWSDWQDGLINEDDCTEVEVRTGYGYYYYPCPDCGNRMHGYPTCYTWAGGCGNSNITYADFVYIYSGLSWDDAGLQDFHGTGKTYTYIDGQRYFPWYDGGSKTQYRKRTRSHQSETNYSDWSEYGDNEVTSTSSKEVRTRTLYRYKDRNFVTTYHFYKWSDWSSWLDDSVESADNREIDTQEVYRYREKVDGTTYYFKRWSKWSEYTDEVQTKTDSLNVKTKKQYRYRPK